MSAATVLVQASPRTAPGLLTAQAWDALRGSKNVLARELDGQWEQALRSAGVAARVSPEQPVGAGQVWFDATDDDLLARELAEAAVRGLDVEVVLGSYDVPGSRLLDLVRVMDRLRSQGGCPWDAKQTHVSLLRYLVEETYEVVEAVETGSRDDLREELGDLLLQVAFHARLASEDDDEPFDVDDVAEGIVEKLVRRHPHVFGRGSQPPGLTAEDVESTWERSKAAEKGRRSALDGIPEGLPVLARAEKVLDRITHHGVPVNLATADDAGQRILWEVSRARDGGTSVEASLRAALRALEDEVRTLEARAHDQASGAGRRQ